ncbi:calcium-binding protein [Roseovarius aestuariivivens]|uniref:calcium-binding protein n=1 Tax=Roseovarius aestuariivivens TaxID=1888910 RepID=UPI001081325B|nr:calcium-binding protein [Roseovarius aestuariivivens]
MSTRLIADALNSLSLETYTPFAPWLSLMESPVAPPSDDPLAAWELLEPTRVSQPEAGFAIGSGDNRGDGTATLGNFAILPIEIHGDDEDNVLHGNAQDNLIYGYAGNDTIYGHSGQNQIDAGWGDDEVVGGSGLDAIAGGNGNDTLWGEGGDDALRGGNDADEMHGGEGADTLFGDAGHDALYGDAGDDWLADHAGDDTFSGGTGADTFVFSSDGVLTLTPGGGQDLILDFELGVDKLIIRNTDPDFTDLSFAEYIEQHAFGQADPGVVIEWENGLIRLEGVSVEDLNPWDIELW